MILVELRHAVAKAENERRKLEDELKREQLRQLKLQNELLEKQLNGELIMPRTTKQPTKPHLVTVPYATPVNLPVHDEANNKLSPATEETDQPQENDE